MSLKIQIGGDVEHKESSYSFSLPLTVELRNKKQEVTLEEVINQLKKQSKLKNGVIKILSFDIMIYNFDKKG